MIPYLLQQEFHLASLNYFLKMVSFAHPSAGFEKKKSVYQQLPPQLLIRIRRLVLEQAAVL